MPNKRRFGDADNQRFGRLVVLREIPVERRSTGPKGPREVVVRCDCGAERTISLANAKANQSCGCWKRERMAGMVRRLKREGRSLAYRKTHGMTGSPEFGVWRSMLSRCYRKKDISYPDYGGRGIRVCDRWRKSFAAFYADMGPRPPAGKEGRYTIERGDVNGDYEKGNCHWATYKEQRNNTRKNRFITINGVTRTLTQWCDTTGIPLGVASARIHRMGWDEARAVTESVRRR